MKKLITSVTVLLLCMAANTINAQQEETAKVEVNIEITKDGNTETITREYDVPAGDNMVWDFDAREGDDGRVIVRKHCTTGNSEDMVWSGFDDHVPTRKVAFLGVKGYTINADTEAPKSVRIMKVIEGEAAEAGGLKNEDILKTIDGSTITTYGDLVDEIRARKPGDQIEVKVDRNGTQKTLTITLGEKEVPDWGQLKGMKHFEGLEGLENIEVRIERKVTTLSENDKAAIKKATGVNPSQANTFDDVALELFPNPAEDELSYEVNMAQGGKLQMMLIDAAGKTVISNNLNSDDGHYNGTIDLQKTSSGNYILLFKRGDMMVSEKLMKK